MLLPLLAMVAHLGPCLTDGFLRTPRRHVLTPASPPPTNNLALTFFREPMLWIFRTVRPRLLRRSQPTWLALLSPPSPALGHRASCHNDLTGTPQHRCWRPKLTETVGKGSDQSFGPRRPAQSHSILAKGEMGILQERQEKLRDT